ncbi:MAG: hypothetical protein U0X75_03180 [Acidobacteriota bacterium]
MEDAPRSGRLSLTSNGAESRLWPAVNSRTRTWTWRMLADKVVELGYCDQIIAHPNRQDSQKNELKPHLNKTWCIGKIDAHFLAQMERILWLYALLMIRNYPVVSTNARAS